MMQKSTSIYRFFSLACKRHTKCKNASSLCALPQKYSALPQKYSATLLLLHQPLLAWSLS